MGWSAGGTLVNELVTVTDRFKAASAGAGVSNWTSLYAQTDDTTSAAPGSAGRRGARTAPNRSLLEQLAAEGRREREDADVLFAG